MSLETIMWLFTAAWILAPIERYVMYQRGWSGSYGEPVTLRQLLVGVPIAIACGTYFAIKASTSSDIAFGSALVILLAFAVYQFIPWLRRGDRRYVPGLASELSAALSAGDCRDLAGHCGRRPLRGRCPLRPRVRDYVRVRAAVVPKKPSMPPSARSVRRLTQPRQAPDDLDKGRSARRAIPPSVAMP